MLSNTKSPPEAKKPKRKPAGPMSGPIEAIPAATNSTLRRDMTTLFTDAPESTEAQEAECCPSGVPYADHYFGLHPQQVDAADGAYLEGFEAADDAAKLGLALSGDMFASLADGVHPSVVWEIFEKMYGETPGTYRALAGALFGLTVDSFEHSDDGQTMVAAAGHGNGQKAIQEWLANWEEDNHIEYVDSDYAERRTTEMARAELIRLFEGSGLTVEVDEENGAISVLLPEENDFAEAEVEYGGEA